MYDEFLQQASHVLQNNIQTLEGLRDESRKRQSRLATSGIEYEAFHHQLKDTIRSLQFARNQLELSSKRLQGSSMSHR